MTIEYVGMEELLRRTLRARAESLRVGEAPIARPDITLRRTLSAAASSSQRVLSGSYQSSCGRITTAAHETDEGRLVIEVASSDEAVAFVTFTWSVFDGEGVAQPFRLVTPLAKIRSGWSVSYDLGDVTAASAISLDAAEELPQAEITLRDVTDALRFGLLGSGARAWRSACDSGTLTAEMALAVRTKLADD